MKRRSVAVLAVILCAAWMGGARGAEAVHFAIIGDRTGSHQPGVYEGIVHQIHDRNPDFIVSVGDQIEGYTEDRATLAKEWSEYLAIVGVFAAPFHIVPGNHDILNDTMESVWRETVGREPNSSFDEQGIHFTILDTGRWETSEEWLAAGDHRAWLERDLAAHAADRLSIVVFHKPYWYQTLAEGKPDPLHEIFKATGVDAVFNGHFHQYGTAVYDGIDYTMVGSSGGAFEAPEAAGGFYHFLWCAVDADGLHWDVARVACHIVLLPRVRLSSATG